MGELEGPSPAEMGLESNPESETENLGAEGANKEKFDPSDKQYKKVEDLPEEYRDNFTNVPEELGGGFVKEKAMESFRDHSKIADKLSEKRFAYKFLKSFEYPSRKPVKLNKGQIFYKKILDKVGVSPTDVAHQEAANPDNQYKNRILLKVVNATSIAELLKELDSLEQGQIIHSPFRGPENNTAADEAAMLSPQDIKEATKEFIDAKKAGESVSAMDAWILAQLGLKDKIEELLNSEALHETLPQQAEALSKINAANSIEELLDVIDSLDKGLVAVDSSDKKFVFPAQGIRKTIEEMMESLKAGKKNYEMHSRFNMYRLGPVGDKIFGLLRKWDRENKT